MFLITLVGFESDYVKRQECEDIIRVYLDRIKTVNGILTKVL